MHGRPPGTVPVSITVTMCGCCRPSLTVISSSRWNLANLAGSTTLITLIAT
jgi:hypothetical protein